MSGARCGWRLRLAKKIGLTLQAEAAWCHQRRFSYSVARAAFVMRCLVCTPFGVCIDCTSGAALAASLRRGGGGAFWTRTRDLSSPATALSD